MATTFCNQQANVTFTDQQLKETYGSSTSTHLLPSTTPSVNDREGTGKLLKASIVTGIVDGLERTGVIPKVGTKQAEQYDQKRQDFLQQVKQEYCFYESRYLYALQRFLSAVTADTASCKTTSTSNAASGQTAVKNYLSIAQELNQRMNDLIQIINEISKRLMDTTSGLQTEMSALNEKLQAQKASLEEQGRIIRSNEATMHIQKQMVKYTEEKARRSDNLLNLYSFLNVVVLGLLVYVYRAAGDE